MREPSSDHFQVCFMDKIKPVVPLSRLKCIGNPMNKGGTARIRPLMRILFLWKKGESYGI